MDILIQCPRCHAHLETPWSPGSAAPEHCGATLFPEATENFLSQGRLNQCPACGADHLYRQKDFNRRLGVALVAIGVLAAYWTYGLSLLAVTLVDWWLYRRVGEVGCCYQCPTQFRGSGVQALEPFNLELHDFYRSKKPH